MDLSQICLRIAHWVIDVARSLAMATGRSNPSDLSCPNLLQRRPAREIALSTQSVAEDRFMVAAESPRVFDAHTPIVLTGRDFADHKFEWYRWMLEEAPVCLGKISVMKVHLVARYDDCRSVLGDPRFIRNRGRAKGKGDGPLPFPLPKSVAALAQSMILEDDPEHRRLRNLVNKAFTPHSVERLTGRVESYSHELIDQLEKRPSVDLLADFARPVPTRVIADMVGISADEALEFQRGLGVLTTGLTGFGILRTLLWDLRRTARFVKELVARKRQKPGDDILSQLIHAEEDGDRLTEDELTAMVFLLIVAGFETTLHLITNGARTLIEQPDSVGRLGAEPGLWDSAVQEIVRYRGPIHGTKMNYAVEDVTLHGVTIEKGAAVMPMLGAANLDPRAFDNPEIFEIDRSPNHHLGFGYGKHFCLGRQLALMETRVALQTLFERCPNTRLTVDSAELEIARLPGWHRHTQLPVALK
jgi:cytochrome P450